MAKRKIKVTRFKKSCIYYNGDDVVKCVCRSGDSEPPYSENCGEINSGYGSEYKFCHVVSVGLIDAARD